MKKDIIKNELRLLLDTIREQQELILRHQGKIPTIELDILKDNVRKYYENVLELSSLPFHPTQVEQNTLIEKEPETFTEERFEAIVNGAEELIQTTEPEVHIQPENIIATVPPIPAEKQTQAPSEAAVITANRSREFSKSPAKTRSLGSLFDETPTVAETYTGGPTVFDKYGAAKTDKSISEKLQNNPVTDLRKSIGINEKFAFINELFDGDMSSYNEAIDKLNNCNDCNQAMEILNVDLSGKYQWTGDGTTFIQLKNLVERRFGA